MARRVRWRGAVVASAILAGYGAVEGNATLLLAATLPLAYLAVGAVSTASVPDSLTTERRIEPRVAPPGRPVAVTVTVTNDGDTTVSDLRAVDPVPDRLAVMDGTPRGGETLAPGETLTLTYSVIARRGEFDFPPVRLRVRGAGAGTVSTADRQPTGDRTLVCRLDADAPPLSDIGDTRVGRLTTDTPGEGLTFHSTREYRHGDPAGRIDWRGYAKQGELSTVNYDRQVSATVVSVLDARPASRVAAGPGRPTAVELGAYAATRTLNTLLAAGHEVAVAVVGVDGDGPGGLVWLPPGSGSGQRAKAISVLSDGIDAAAGDRSPTGQARRLGELAGRQSQFVLVSPLLDEAPLEMLEQWSGFGQTRTVLSPDIVAENTVSGQFEQVRRRTRLARAQAGGARAIDWRRGTPLPTILDAVFAVEAHRAGAGVRAGGGH
ncbi:DUF58 domain-containing protein [Haloarcula onubensis]|uniref:DUF58 domain-containing protein n=1 Tax=Haloarcula onubensis TaxID=2950539 RepID=A0ABU2FR14_9EURY|nr:DUF58 domain-containing protein [Halomicroarcula sp. S3CR25-11]MDS0283209.1 DUF58 domain-containing protein [Halomicroarcula sp. S3CR25-11]